MYKHRHKPHNAFDVDYFVPALPFFAGKEFGIATLMSRFFDLFIAWTERMARRSTRI